MKAGSAVYRYAFIFNISIERSPHAGHLLLTRFWYEGGREYQYPQWLSWRRLSKQREAWKRKISMRQYKVILPIGSLGHKDLNLPHSHRARGHSFSFLCSLAGVCPNGSWWKKWTTVSSWLVSSVTRGIFSYKYMHFPDSMSCLIGACLVNFRRVISGREVQVY